MRVARTAETATPPSRTEPRTIPIALLRRRRLFNTAFPLVGALVLARLDRDGPPYVDGENESAKLAAARDEQSNHRTNSRPVSHRLSNQRCSKLNRSSVAAAQRRPTGR